MKSLRTLTTSTILALAALVLLVSAQPHLQRRGLPGAVYICNDPNFGGDCQWSPPSDRCVIQGGAGVGSESIGPDPDGGCTLYQDSECTPSGEIQTVRFPGIASDLPKFGSMRCFANKTIVKKDELQVASMASTDTMKVLDPLADPRLAGCVGSADRNENLEAIEDVEADDFEDGLIGLKEGVYY